AHTHPSHCSAAFSPADIKSARGNIPMYLLKGIRPDAPDEGANGGVFRLVMRPGANEFEANNLARKTAGPEFWE
ncbi:MAG: hypothetical protein N3A38_17065, partial [Planctomycetota bacterium]|nr:hypothetical protein [Planctomycetota bacterium]